MRTPYTKQALEALQAAHGPVLVLSAGDAEIAVRKLTWAGPAGPDGKPTQGEFSVFMQARRNKDPDAVELVLRRAVVGIDDEATKAEQAYLTELLNEDPQLGDAWGAILLRQAGWQAEVDVKDLGAGVYTLAPKLAGAPTVQAKRLSRQQWREYRRFVQQCAGDDAEEAAQLQAFKVATGQDPATYETFPALPYVLGQICTALGTKVGDASIKNF